MKIAFFIYLMCSYVFSCDFVLALQAFDHVDEFCADQSEGKQMRSNFHNMITKSRLKRAMNAKLKNVPNSTLSQNLEILEYDFSSPDFSFIDNYLNQYYQTVQLPNIDAIPRAQTPQIVVDIESGIVDYSNYDVTFDILNIIPNADI